MKQMSLKDPLIKILIIIICISVGAIIIGKKFIIKPHKEKIIVLMDKLEHIKLEDEIAKIQSEINACEKSLPPHKEQGWLLGQITRLAQQSKLDISSIEPLPLKQIQPYSYISFRINATCTFVQLGKFIQLVESGPYILRIENLKLESQAEYKLEVPKEELNKEIPANVEIVVGTMY